ncbi:unnamed protein product [Paramecium pentaurelia]|uniref:Uncharacterized protein n=1 Tax=Paramecium pentaurelia TaxID=43138 RepID=A0A8S1WY07_9CILI|nr:unnamed protein product [Paramecium pentaurelia]
MDQEIRPKCKSIIKRQSTLDNENQIEQGQHQSQNKDQHVKFGEMHVDMILKEDQYQIQEDKQNSIQKPKQYKNLSEAELIKLALKKPEVLEEDEQ